MSSDEAIAIWRQLGVRGDNLEGVLAQIEAAGAGAAAVMGQAVLELPTDDECVVVVDEYVAPVERAIPDIQPSDGFDHPCVRRALRRWALAVVPASRLATDLRGELILIAGAGEPEDELIRAAYARVADEALLLAMLDETERSQEVLADELALALSPSGRVTAAVALAIDGALLSLDRAAATEAYIAALAAGQVRPTTQRAAVARLATVAAAADPASPIRARIIATFAAARAGGPCEVGAAAIDAHARLIGRGFPLDLPAPTSVAAIEALMCRAATSQLDATALWRTLIPARGLTVEIYDSARTDALWMSNRGAPDANGDGVPDVADADPDGDGDPFRRNLTVRVPRRGRFVMPYLDRLPAVLAGCWDLDCSDYRGASATLEITPTAAGRVQLTRIRWHIESEPP